MINVQKQFCQNKHSTNVFPNENWLCNHPESQKTQLNKGIPKCSQRLNNGAFHKASITFSCANGITWPKWRHFLWPPLSLDLPWTTPDIYYPVFLAYAWINIRFTLTFSFNTLLGFSFLGFSSQDVKTHPYYKGFIYTCPSHLLFSKYNIRRCWQFIFISIENEWEHNLLFSLL